MTVIQQRISLEYASTLTGDPEAHLRGYVDQQTIEDAQLLANACIQMPTFGQIGFLADVGEPHQWWEQNSPIYAELEQSAKYSQARKFSALLKITNYLIRNPLLDAVEGRIAAMELTGSGSSPEAKDLKKWFAVNQRAL
jgi:hypothetical protein